MTKSTLNSAVNFLKNTRIFKDADEKILTSVLNTYGKSVSYSKNEIVFSKETYSPVLCLIIKGEARVSKGETVISHLKDGEIFVEASKCADKVCLRSGKISKAGEGIICAPNRVSIEIDGKKVDLPDAMTG